ncbi:ATP-grasp domain-containing protein [Piscinibacter terrae]|uniref:ATP-grasp domain-containing protein n=1 Tax=Piscinibacter terrae TaxID=2496871 RepID=A0A3N7HKG7_9BURK|nr:ATP-grasp domain-containing protein [Albitalea terrae]RQP22580.1 ATP-grasp domain-containing protein [Albitalea terrae]
MVLKNAVPQTPGALAALGLPVAAGLRRPVLASHPARLLVLFGADWDHRVLPDYNRTGCYRFHEHGFDLFRFPSNAQLMWFDIWRFVDRLVQRYRGRIDGVFSSNEQFGALASALVAQRLHLPGPEPLALLRTQHKHEARQRLRQVAPELCPDFELISCNITPQQARRLRYPLFVKPVKATFSVLARRCDTPEQLIGHLRLRRWERHILERLIAPHEQAMARYPQLAVDSHHLVVEEVIEGRQVNVDGVMHRGEFHLLGISDELTYPGTNAFMRFACPDSLDASTRSRIVAASERVLRGFGLAHGAMNLEFFVLRDGSLRLIEVNPRLAAQLAPLHEWVGGVDPYEMAFAVALDRPLPTPRPASFGAAASFVWRRFNAETCPRMPSSQDLQWLSREFPQARLELYPKSGASLARELRWLGSHRYAVLNMPAEDTADLRDRYQRVCDRFGWPAPW